MNHTRPVSEPTNRGGGGVRWATGVHYQLPASLFRGRQMEIKAGDDTLLAAKSVQQNLDIKFSRLEST